MMKAKHVAIEDSLIDYQQTEYLITIEVGSRKEVHNVMIDTGSSDLWLPSVGASGFKRLSISLSK